MLLVLFKVGGDQYAIEAKQVHSIIPVLEVKEVGGIGVIDYLGKLLPVVDITEVISGEKTKRFMSSRIILVEFLEKKLVGLMAEQVVDTLLVKESGLEEMGFDSRKAPYLEKIIKYNEQLVQCIAINKLVSEDVRELLLED